MKKEKVLGLLTIVLVMAMSMVFGSLQAEAYTFSVTKSAKKTTSTIYVTKGEKVSLKLRYRKNSKKAYKTQKLNWNVTSGSSKAKLLKSKNSNTKVKSKKATTVYVKGLKKGNATIQTTYKGKKYKANIVVESDLNLNKTSLDLYAGGSESLIVKNTKRKPTWSVTSGKDVVQVDNNGKVTALKKGTAKVQAKVGDKKFICNINVKSATDFPTVAWSMVEERLRDSSNSPWDAYSNSKTTVIRGCTKDFSISGVLTKEEISKIDGSDPAMENMTAYEREKIEKPVLDKAKYIYDSITITSNNPNVVSVKKVSFEDAFLNKGKIATATIKGVGTATITLKTPKQTLTFQITGLKTALDLRDEQIADFKKNYIKANMSEYDKICALREYVIANYKKQTDFNKQNPTGKEGEIYYMYQRLPAEKNGLLLYYSKEGSCTVFASMVGDFCHELGIECKLYGSVDLNHAWNYLKLNGNWYKVDMSASPIIPLPEKVTSIPNDAVYYQGWLENNN